jgi:hypothetical protein
MSQAKIGAEMPTEKQWYESLFENCGDWLWVRLIVGLGTFSKLTG